VLSASDSIYFMTSLHL